MAEIIPSVLEKYKNYDAVVGIEVHTQLKTNSKIFCSCPNKFGDQPNTNICPICVGHPGILPKINKKVIDFAIMLGLATNCKIRKNTKFARKHYMYPDLPKNYQITQSDYPICYEGFISIILQDNCEKNIRIKRIHMEEDSGKAIHATEAESYIDLNRAGTPLLEIVSYPDISSAYEAKAYLTQLKTIVQYIGISDANMEEGSFRADVNISVKKKDSSELGTKVELKNINSFKFIYHAIENEIERQIKILESGKTIKQETRGWDSKKQESIFMRSKEEAMDYRYLDEPDLPLISINHKWLTRIKNSIPELPINKFNRFLKDYNLTNDEAEILINDIELANFFEKTVRICNNPKQACNWILRDLISYLKESKLSLEQSKISPEKFAQLILLIDNGTINSKTAQDVFLEMAQTNKEPNLIIKEKNLSQIESEEELEQIINQVIKENPEQFAQYKQGKEKLFTFFVGQTMKATKGKGNPLIIQNLLKKLLSN